MLYIRTKAYSLYITDICLTIHQFGSPNKSSSGQTGMQCLCMIKKDKFRSFRLEGTDSASEFYRQLRSDYQFLRSIISIQKLKVAAYHAQILLRTIRTTTAPRSETQAETTGSIGSVRWSKISPTFPISGKLDIYSAAFSLVFIYA